METETLIIIYVILLVITIVLVVMKKTNWGSIIGVALIPIYFFFVLWDVFSALKDQSETEENKGEDSGAA